MQMLHVFPPFLFHFYEPDLMQRSFLAHEFNNRSTHFLPIHARSSNHPGQMYIAERTGYISYILTLTQLPP
jgi:hypothetical protein